MILIDTANTAAVTGQLAGYQVPVYDLAAGKIQYHIGNASPTAKIYVGGEPAVDPFTKQPLLHQAGDLVYDLFTGAQLFDIAGNPRVYLGGEPVLHSAGDAVISGSGDVLRYLGGEQVYDESGAVVRNGDGSNFLHLGSQAYIHNRRDQVFDVINSAGVGVTLGSAYTPPSFAVAGNAATPVTVANYDLKTGDTVGVVVYQGAKITRLASSQFAVDLANDRVTINSLGIIGTVTVKLIISTPAKRVAGESVRYYGDELVQVGQPKVNSDGALKLDENGKVSLYTTTVDSKGRPVFHSRGEQVYRLKAGVGNGPYLQDDFVAVTYAGGELKLFLGNEPVLRTGGEQVFYTDADAKTVASQFFRISGLGLANGLLYRNLELVEVKLGSGADQFTVRATQGATNLFTGGGNDTVNVYNDYFSLDEILGALSVDAQGGDRNRLIVSDQDDSNADASVLITSSFISGLAPRGFNTWLRVGSSRAITLRALVPSPRAF